MDNTAKKLKEIVKGVAPKSTFGTDPKDPWSARAGITEGALEQYLLSRGINPKFVSTQTKISHAKSSAFLKWKQDHMVESTDKKDTVVLDIPLLIRVLELAREDIKTDMDLHRVVEKLISIRTKGVLTMADYDTIANINENHIAIAMGRMLDDEGSMVLDQLEQLERAITMIRTYVGKDYTKQMPAWVQSKVTLATDYIDTVGNYLSSKNEETVSEMDKSQDPPGRDGGHQFPPGPKVSKKVIKAINKDPAKHLSDLFAKEYAKKKVKEETEQIDEVSSELLDRYKEKAKKSADELTAKGQHRKSTNRWMGVMKATGKQIEKTTANIRKSLNKESDCGCMDDGKNKKLIQMSKSARIIKSIYKRKGMSEDMYDWEKENKSVASYGKQPSMKTVDAKKNVGDKAQAAAVLTGGKTLTGQTRDTLEIDPIMRKAGPLDQNKKI